MPLFLHSRRITFASGQTEVSGITVDPDHGYMWMCSWAEDESGSYLYKYDLESGEYLGKDQDDRTDDHDHFPSDTVGFFRDSADSSMDPDYCFRTSDDHFCRQLYPEQFGSSAGK